MVATCVMCGVAVADPLAVNAGLYPTIPASRLGPPEWVEATRAHALDRVYVGGRIGKDAGRQQMPAELVDSPSHFRPLAEWTMQEALTTFSAQFAPTPAAWRLREVISFDLPQLWPREYVTLLSTFRNASPAERLRFLRRTGHRYCFVPQPPLPGARALSRTEIVAPMALYECYTDPLRVYVTAAAVVEPDLRRQIELLFDEQHDPFSTVLLERSAPAPDGRPGAGSPAGNASIVRERNTELTVRVEVPGDGGYLTVVDSYDPFWIVEVDGQPGTLLRANGLFRAVRLAPGPHDVRFAYRPTPFYAGLAVTCSVGVLLLFGCFRNRRSSLVK